MKYPIINAAGAFAITVGTILSSSDAVALSQCGKASWYEFRSRTASGEMADPKKLTAAHRTFRLEPSCKSRISEMAKQSGCVSMTGDQGQEDGL